MKRQKLRVGIDPDVSKSGLAVYNLETKEFEMLESVDFFTLQEVLLFYQQNDDISVILEGAWKIKKANWHGGNPAIAQKIAQGVGKNHAVGMLIEQFLIKNDIEHEVVIPVRGKKKRKLDAETFKEETGYVGRTNQDVRDSGCLACGIN